MNYEDFKNMIKGHVKEYLPEEYEGWEFHEINFLKVNEKNEGFSLINPNACDDARASINIYYDVLYDMYERGCPIEKLLEDVAMLIQTGNKVLDEELRLLDVNDYECIKDKLIVELVNKDKNAELLETLVHREYLSDLVVVCRIVLDNHHSALVTKYLFEEWEISEDELFKDAYYNTPKKSGFELRRTGEDMGMPDSVLVLTNDNHIFGAAGMLYPDNLKTAEELLGGDFYLLPASIHEMFLIDTAGRDIEGLKDFVKFANTVLIAPEEYLSDNIFYYDRTSGEVSVA